MVPGKLLKKVARIKTKDEQKGRKLIKAIQKNRWGDMRSRRERGATVRRGRRGYEQRQNKSSYRGSEDWPGGQVRWKCVWWPNQVGRDLVT